jgi:hypothetical protein
MKSIRRDVGECLDWASVRCYYLNHRVGGNLKVVEAGVACYVVRMQGVPLAKNSNRRGFLKMARVRGTSLGHVFATYDISKFELGG